MPLLGAMVGHGGSGMVAWWHGQVSALNHGGVLSTYRQHATCKKAQK